MSETEIHTFKAATMQEALNIVRRELGSDAVILHTRELPQPRFPFFSKQTERVEVTAGLGINVAPPKALVDAQRAAANRAAAAPQSAEFHAAPRAPHFTRPPVSRHAPAAEAPSPRESVRPGAWPTEGGRISTPQQTPQPEQKPLTTPASPPPPPAQSSAAVLVQQASIARQLKTIQEMIEQLNRRTNHVEEIPPELFALYAELIGTELEDDIARTLVCQLRKQLSADDLTDDAFVRRRLVELVQSQLRVGRPIEVTPGQRRVVALVGPTGVGKTTTIAKLAANFRLREGIRIGLVTVDTYRIAAVEQLRTYAEIIDLPMRVVTTPREMTHALDEFAGLDLVLVDTAGRSPRDDIKIHELRMLLGDAQVDEVHLVLSLVSSLKSLKTTAETFSSAGVTSLILTKLDEAVGLGALLAIANQTAIPVSYLTTGQDVPDDIEPAALNRMTRLILGQERLGNT